MSLADVIGREELVLNGTEKENYIKYRAPLVSDFLGLFEKRLSQGTKERCVIIIIGDFDAPQSRTCLQELSIDLSSVVYWRTGHLPGVIRFAISCEETSSSDSIEDLKTLLSPVRMQYFHTPRFEVEAAKRPSGETAPQPEALKPSKAPIYNGVCVNPYDILVCASEEAALEQFLREVLVLQKMEAEYASQHQSIEYGSGGSLYLVEGKLVSSVSGWRRIDWLVLAQVSFLPRYWCLNDPTSLADFIALFNYRHWVSRFDGLEEHDMSNLQIVAYPDSDLKKVKKALKHSSKFNMSRRKREADWKDVDSMTTMNGLGFKKDDAKLSSSAATARNYSLRPDVEIWDPLESESNDHRITSGHLEALKELVVFYNREQRFSEALKALRALSKTSVTLRSRGGRATTSATKTRAVEDGRKLQLSAEFNKLEGIALLGIGDSGSATRKLSLYRDYLESMEEDSRLLGRALDATNSARLWAEVAGVYSACSNFAAAQTAASRALTLEATQPSALKTLVLAAGRSGASSIPEEEWIFGFFATSKSLQLEDAHEYYEKRTKKFPNNGFFWYGFAMFTFVMARNLPACAPLFERAVTFLPQEARIAESYATYLFQSRSPKLRLIKQLYDTALDLEPSSLLTRANSAAFFLFLRSSQLEYLSLAIKSTPKPGNSTTNSTSKNGASSPVNRGSGEDYPLSDEEMDDAERREVLEGFDQAQHLLESVLFSVTLIDEHPQVYLECWFYVLCYTMERERQLQALQYLKAALRKGLRARHWDMSMHLRYLRKHALMATNDMAWAHTLARVIGDREPLDALDQWASWTGLKSDKLVSSFKLAERSFRVCVSPSKRREKREEASPPALSKAKSAPLRQISSPLANVFQDELTMMTSPTAKKTSTPKEVKATTSKVSAAKRVGKPRPAARSPDTPDLSTNDLKARHSSSVGKGKFVEPEGDDDDLLSMLETSSVTSAASSSTTSKTSPAPSLDSLSALDSSFGFDESSRLRRSTSGAGSVLLSTTSVSVPARLAKSRTQPLPQLLSNTVAKTTRAAAPSSRSKIDSTSTPPSSSTQRRARAPAKDTKSTVSEPHSEARSDADIFDYSPEPTSKIAVSKTPTLGSSEFEESVPRRPTRAATAEPKATKRQRRI